MSLLDDLRNAARAVDIQFQPTANEVQGVVAALIHYAEHGQAFLTAAEAGVEDVAKLLSPPAESSAVSPVAVGAGSGTEAASPAPLTDEQLQAQIADLQAQLATRAATAQQTTVIHEQGAGAEPSTSSSGGVLGFLGKH